MASRKLLLASSSSSTSLAAKLSNLTLGGTSSLSSRRVPNLLTAPSLRRTAAAVSSHNNKNNSHLTMRRHFSNGGGGKYGDGDNDRGGEDNTSDDTDFFGVGLDDSNYLRDGTPPWGPSDSLPPVYKRDAATGRFTGDVELELSAEQRKLLQADEFQRDKIFKKRVEEYWQQENKNASSDKDGSHDELNALGKRIRETKMALNVLGRSVQAQAATEQAAAEMDGIETGRDKDSHFSQPRLTREEFESFQAYMKKRYKVEVPEDEMPIMLEQGGSKYSSSSKQQLSPDDSVLATKWMTSQAQRQMDDRLDDNPYKDLMPADMSPSRVVNRKQAKPIPVELLHHNNIPLLQSFLTETGQIQSRIQSRLGARDQRRIARLVKRARCLGIMPYQGQFRSEQHGWVHAKDLDEPRPWEKELERRGLVINNNNNDSKMDRKKRQRSSHQQEGGGGGEGSGEEAL